MTTNKFKLVTVIFIVGVSVIISEAVDPSGNQFNAPHQILESIILHSGRIQQKPEPNILTARITNNVKENSNLELLGGYRPLFPPYFPLKNPYANTKLYSDQEYYTRGTDEILLDNENQNSQSVTTLTKPAVPLIQNTQIFFKNNNNNNNNNNNDIYNKKARFYQEARSSVSSISATQNVQYLPSVITTHSNVNNHNQHQVTFITYQ
ncbi:probable ATP-dependent RNA helicase ddx20 [Leptopilina heterotoma]|uniref:probable ATP-dependent RNA helicase ddx20 n=1 Tax=Leptopilina heterotoma TaxID=63436 RepID=UPI001CA89529|nr:probable ATP-dependent RNA helicase ddx20 [Leptopilina heterotoma]